VRVLQPGDGNNVCHSLMIPCTRLGADCVAAPTPGYESDSRIAAVSRCDGSVELAHDPREALLALVVG